MTASKVRADQTEGGLTGIFRTVSIADTEDSDDVPTIEREEALPDDTFEILRNARRRYALRILADRGGSVELTVLASAIASIENEKPPSEIDETERKRVYISLYQCHVTRMAEAGIVEYDEESRSVTITPRGAELAVALEAFARGNGGHARIYLGIAVVAIVLSATTSSVAANGPALFLLGIGLSFLAMALVSRGFDFPIRAVRSSER